MRYPFFDLRLSNRLIFANFYHALSLGVDALNSVMSCHHEDQTAVVAYLRRLGGEQFA